MEATVRPRIRSASATRCLPSVAPVPAVHAVPSHGARFYNWAENECATWAASVYRPARTSTATRCPTTRQLGLHGRATYLPYDSSEGDDYLNVGLGYNHVSAKDRAVRFRSIPEYFVGESASQTPIGTSGQAVPGPVNGIPFFVDTGNFAANHYNLVGTELLWVKGPLTVMSEANYNFVAQTNGPAVGFPGLFVQAGWFLTGEHRPFNRKLAQVDRIAVKHKVGWDPETCCWGWGGWELARAVLLPQPERRDIQGGRIQDGTLGINGTSTTTRKSSSTTSGRSSTIRHGVRARPTFSACGRQVDF